MSKVGKYLLVIASGLVTGSAIIAIPSVIFKSQRDYQQQQAKLKQTETVLIADVKNSINKSETLASQIVPNDIIFKNYDDELFTVSLVEISTQLKKQLSLAPNVNVATEKANVQYLTADDKKGLIELKYKIQSKKYADLFIIGQTAIKGFKVANPSVKVPEKIVDEVKPLKELADSIRQPILRSYALISSDQAKGLNPDQNQLITKFANIIADDYVNGCSGILTTTEKFLSTNRLTKIKNSYQNIVLKLNNILTDILNAAIETKSSDFGAKQVTDYFTVQKLSEIKKLMSEALKSEAEVWSNTVTTILETLKTNKDTKDINKIDSFINEFSSYFNLKVVELANKINEMPISSENSTFEVLKQIINLIPESKKALETKVSKILTNESELNAVNNILKLKFDKLTDVIVASLEKLKNHVSQMGDLIDNLKLKTKTDIPENKDLVSFKYDDGKNVANVAYDQEQNKLIIKDIERIDQTTFSQILMKADKELDAFNSIGITLECPDTKELSLIVNGNYSINKVILPKLEKMLYDNEYNLDSTGLWTNRLSGDKVVINGILFKWKNPSGDINDESITQILPHAFRDTSKVISFNLPNVKYIYPKAFTYSNENDAFPKIKSKIVLNGTLIKWDDATGAISDANVTKVYKSAFQNNDKITSISFPNAIEIDDYAFNKATNLMSIDLPKVTKVGVKAFEGDSNLTSYQLPKALDFGYKSFSNTNKLDDKLIINGVLVKWDNASGNVFDDKITKIADGVFAHNEKLIKVDFPNVIEIGGSAFERASKLIGVHLPKVETLGWSAFSGAMSLKSAIFPNVKTINPWVFFGAIALEEASFTNATKIGYESFARTDNLKTTHFPKVITIDESAFQYAKALSIASFPEAKEIKNYAFSSATNLSFISAPKIEKIGFHAFEETPKLNEKLVLGTTLVKWDNASGDIFDNKITKIATEAFKNNHSITKVDFPNVTEIEESAFMNANKLEGINFPKAEIIGDNAFSGTTKLTTTSFPEVKSIGYSAFQDAISLTSANFPKAIFMKSNAFSGTRNLININFPELNSISYHSFSDASSLVEANFPKVKRIGSGAFKDAINLSKISFPNLKWFSSPNIFKNTPKLGDKIIIDGVLVKWDNAKGDIVDENILKINPGTFENNNNITSVDFPNVVSIGFNAFLKAENLKSVNFPKVKTIESSAFRDTKQLKEISLPLVEEIGDSAFQSSTSLTTIKLPNLKKLGSQAFVDNTSLESAILPKVEIVEESAFRNNENLKFISLPNVTSVERYAFLNAKKLSLISAPNLTEIGEYAFENNEELKTIDMPKIKYIDKGTFSRMKNLTSAYLPELILIDKEAFLDNPNLTTFHAPNLKYIASDAFNNTPNLNPKPTVKAN
ncbi:leucine-rich repeat protein [Mycoplasma sp. 2634B]|uniref:leucine-rich repeat domain-containing protein n=1 Tax=Mycoplasma sp. 2634B TaxID=3401692 RepID=UPI003AAEE398